MIVTDCSAFMRYEWRRQAFRTDGEVLGASMYFHLLSLIRMLHGARNECRVLKIAVCFNYWELFEMKWRLTQQYERGCYTRRK